MSDLYWQRVTTDTKTIDVANSCSKILIVITKEILQLIVASSVRNFKIVGKFSVPDLLPLSFNIGAIQKVCHRPRGRGVKQNSDNQWQGEGGQAKQWCHHLWENFVTDYKTIDFLW